MADIVRPARFQVPVRPAEPVPFDPLADDGADAIAQLSRIGPIPDAPATPVAARVPPRPLRERAGAADLAADAALAADMAFAADQDAEIVRHLADTARTAHLRCLSLELIRRLRLHADLFRQEAERLAAARDAGASG